jgi:hypothetical protein
MGRHSGKFENHRCKVLINFHLSTFAGFVDPKMSAARHRPSEISEMGRVEPECVLANWQLPRRSN